MEPKIKALKDPKQIAPIDEMQLIEQVGQWATKNFANKREPEWGIVEEIGEAAHCRLKNFQKIRGFENYDFFIDHITDAFADTIIYLADWCYMHQTFFKFQRNQIEPHGLSLEDERRITVHLLQGAAQMMAFEIIAQDTKIEAAEQGAYNVTAQRMCNGIEYWANAYGIDLPLAVATIWARKVSKRDWVKNPTGPSPELV